MIHIGFLERAQLGFAAAHKEEIKMANNNELGWDCLQRLMIFKLVHVFKI